MLFHSTKINWQHSKAKKSIKLTHKMEWYKRREYSRKNFKQTFVAEIPNDIEQFDQNKHECTDQNKLYKMQKVDPLSHLSQSPFEVNFTVSSTDLVSV